jgi:hypothetical protein
MSANTTEDGSQGLHIIKKRATHQWLTPVMPTIWEAEIRGIMVQGQPGQTV